MLDRRIIINDTDEKKNNEFYLVWKVELVVEKKIYLKEKQAGE